MREDRFTGKVAIVTGGASGIGEATVRGFAKEGAKVVIADINAESGQAIVAELKASGQEAAFVHVNVGLTEDCKKIVNFALETYGKIDILVNCAGVLSRHKLEELDENEWDRVVPINAKAYFTTMRLVVPWMAEHGGGTVVNVASLAGVKGDSFETVYAFCKAGIIQMTKDIAHEFGRRGVRLNCISPGATPSALNRHLPELQELINIIPLGRFGEARDQANAILFLASDEASWITGKNLIVDGGDFLGY
ncbi:SDR family oxidoreductase [Dehalobacter sp. DCM]|uniref:SDR family NAD(P)-dependent oxidoreductase n=1 Tax=Dehalobacter sp. DCM TaxID=2907827 RepID=UPI003081B49F|nr:SDR family oxidoreductase [Dehalobacter sp. DCM]